MKTELLAPAGSIDALHAALVAGADAVYIGGSRFGARAYADNPDEADLCEAIRLTHRLGKKLYMTVNTLMKDEELEKEFYDWMKPYVLEGLDGVIIQDFGAVDLCRKVFPELPLHASTQMAVTGVHSARLLQTLGFERVVPARELSLEEIRAIHEETGIEIEAFAHGAMCYSYSGLCLMSSLIGGRSGNRGRCAGVCRLPFEVYADGKNLTTAHTRYPLNMKDMCTISLLPEMMDAGIMSYKIEGRMKKPEYTAGVVKIYRKYLDLAAKDPEHYRVDPADERYLWELFNRDGFNEGCYKERNGKDLIALRNEKLSDVRADAAKEITEALRKELADRETKKKLQAEVTGVLTVTEGEPLQLSLDWNHRVHTDTVLGVAESAKNQPLSEERLRTQLNKTGNDAFRFTELTVHLSGQVFVPMQMLNELRRTAFAELETAIEAVFRRQELSEEERMRADAAGAVDTDRDTDTVLGMAESAKNQPLSEACLRTQLNKTGDDIFRFREHPHLWVEAETAEQLEAIAKETSAVAGVYLSQELLLEEQSRKIASGLWEQGIAICLALPHMLRLNGEERIRAAIACYQNTFWDASSAFLVRNLEELGLLQEFGLSDRVLLDASVYTMNTRAEHFWRTQGFVRNTMSHELNAREMFARENTATDLVVYGRAPMMITAHCLQKTMRSCNHRNERLTLVDRKGAAFPVQCNCHSCYNVIYNAHPLSLAKEWDAIRKMGFAAYRIALTNENEEETRAILRAFAGHGELAITTTKEHFRRGVE